MDHHRERDDESTDLYADPSKLDEDPLLEGFGSGRGGHPGYDGDVGGRERGMSSYPPAQPSQPSQPSQYPPQYPPQHPPQHPPQPGVYPPSMPFGVAPQSAPLQSYRVLYPPVMPAPQPLYPPQQGPEGTPVDALGNPIVQNHYSTSLFDCFDDGKTCLLGLFCWPYLSTKNHIKLQGRTEFEGSDWLLCAGTCASFLLLNTPVCAFLITYKNRLEIRHRWQFTTDEALEDVCSILFCGPCSECQQTRELEVRMAPPHAPPPM
eukprot:TRINITY_DN848_c0_g1_i1.p1 TRINITY_DN848_c0_g1~~TRINITY_DN848_c0_g1_i1.p1  ORF type:complete len:263 (+),score=61.27 TRINITY_DN848_c0_g1_i1:113-901(+)